MEPYEMSESQCIDLIDSPTYELFIESNPKFVQHCEEWNLLVEDAEVKLEREEESEVPNVLPEPPKKN